MLYADKAALENRTKAPRRRLSADTSSRSPAVTANPAVQVRLLAIRERELELYVNNCRTMGMVSAIFSGLGFFGLVYTKLDYFKDANCGWHSHQAPEWSECPIGEAMVGGGCQACGDEAPCDSSDCDTGTTYSAAIGACVSCGGEYRQALFVAANLLTMCCGLEAAFGTTAITMLGPGLALRGPDGSMNKAVEGILAEYELVSYLVYLSIYSFLAAGAVFAFLAEAPNLLTSLGLTALVAATYRVLARRVHVVEENFPMKKIALVSGAFFDHSAPRAAAGGGAITATVTTPSGGGGAERPKMTLAERRGYAQLHDIVE